MGSFTVSDNKPIKIVAIYDYNYGEKSTLDRYTVITDAVVPANNDPMHDQFMYLGCDEGGRGFSQWGHIERATYADLLKKQTQGFKAITHLGHLVPFEQLTGETQAHIARRVFEEEV